MKDWKEICQVKGFQIEGIEIPAVSLGTSPFIGAAQFGARSIEYYRNFYLNPQNMEEVIKKSVELGVPAIQAIAYKEIIQAIKNVQDSLQVKLFCSITIGMDNWRKEIEESKIIDPRVAFIFPSISDLGNKENLKEIIDEIKKAGMLPGCATHSPVKTLPFLDDSGLDIGIYMAPINRVGKYLGTPPEKMAALIEGLKRPVMGKKVLAAGTIEPAEAFSFVSKIKNVKGVALGIASIREAVETLGQAKKFWTD